MDTVDKVQGAHSDWTMSMDSVDIVQSTCSNTPAGQCPWKMSTESMDFLQVGKGHISIIQACQILQNSDPRNRTLEWALTMNQEI